MHAAAAVVADLHWVLDVELVAPTLTARPIACELSLAEHLAPLPQQFPRLHVDEVR